MAKRSRRPKTAGPPVGIVDAKQTPADTPSVSAQVKLASVASPAPAEAALTATPAEAAPEVLTTGLEDYGRWLVMFQNCPRDENAPPFRRGRIWA